jgi:hypothetical protein
MVVLDLIKGALRPLNAFTGNTELTDAEAADALQACNWMLESWANEGATLYHVTRETHALTAGMQPHTWGDGGVITSPRPIRLLAVTVNVSGVDYPVEILGYDDWEAIRLKSLQTPWPVYCYLESDYPLAKLWLWPVPSGNSLNTVSEKQLTAFGGLHDTVSLPPGYADAIRYNLAVRLAPEYQVDVGPDVRRLAALTMKAIMRTKSRTPTINIDPALRSSGRSRYNVYTDGYR